MMVPPRPSNNIFKFICQTSQTCPEGRVDSISPKLSYQVQESGVTHSHTGGVTQRRPGPVTPGIHRSNCMCGDTDLVADRTGCRGLTRKQLMNPQYQVKGKLTDAGQYHRVQEQSYREKLTMINKTSLWGQTTSTIMNQIHSEVYNCINMNTQRTY